MKLDMKGFKKLLKVTGTKVQKGTRQTALGYANVDPANRMILAKWLPIYYRNLIDNFYKIDQGASLSNVAGSKRGMPALIIAPGPSLDQVIDKINDIRDQVVIFACDSVLKTLEAKNIIPDFVVNAHCTEKIKQCVEGVDTTKHTLITPTVCARDVFDDWKGKKLFYNIFHPKLEFFELALPKLFPKIPKVPNAGSTAGVCVHIAHMLGCDPLIFCGVDFGFPKKKYCCTSYKKDKGGRWRVRKIDHRKKINDKTRGTQIYRKVKCWPEHIRYRDAIQAIQSFRPIRMLRGTTGGIMDKDFKYVDITALDSLKPRTNMQKYDIAYKIPYYGSQQGSIGLMYAELAVKSCPGVKSVIDVGCGPGWAVKKFHELGLAAVGMEPCAYLHRKALKDMAEFIGKEKAQDLPFRDRAFDLVFCTEVLEHIPEEDAIKAVAELARVCKKYIFATIATEAAISLPSLNLHCTLKPEKWWDKEFLKHGLTRIRAKRVFIYKKGR